MRRRQRGQSMVEYFVVAGLVLTALLTPIQMGGKTDTVVNFLLNAMKSEQAGFLYAIQPQQPRS
jgi:hypothetical protein